MNYLITTRIIVFCNKNKKLEMFAIKNILKRIFSTIFASAWKLHRVNAVRTNKCCGKSFSRLLESL